MKSCVVVSGIIRCLLFQSQGIQVSGTWPVIKFMPLFGSYNQNLLFLLLVSGIVLFSGCNVTEVKDESEEERECPLKSGIDPDSSPNCYYWHNWYPSWSPDGRYIASIAPKEVLAGHTIATLFLYEVSTGERQHIIDGADNMSSQAWSPDGEWLTFSMGAQIYKIRVDGTDLTRLTENENRAYFDPAWSPDGKWIVYSDGSAGGKSGIWLLHLDEFDRRWVAPQKGAHPNWIDDHTIVTTRSIRADDIDYRFFVWNPFTNSKPDTLDPREDAINTRQRYNSINNSIVFQSQHRFEGDINIWKIHSDGTGLTRLTENGGAHPAWSPDGNTVAYVNIDYFEGRGKIWLMDPDGTNRRPMLKEEVLEAK